MKNLKDFKKIYNIVDILEQEGILDDKFVFNGIKVYEKSNDYNMKICFSYSSEKCEEICMISLKFLGEMNFIALVEFKYDNGKLEMQKSISFMNSGLDEKLFILSTNDNLQLSPDFCYYYGSLEENFIKMNAKEITTSINKNVKKLEITKNKEKNI